MNTIISEKFGASDNNAKGKPGVTNIPQTDERLKIFFLEEARLLCPATHINCSEYSKMYALYKRLKRMVRLFNLLYDHNWGEVLPDLQRACGFYLLEGYTSKKERLRIIDLLAKEVGFVTQAAQFNDFISILQQHYTHQLAEMERMLNEYYKPEGIEWNPLPPEIPTK